MSIPSAAEIAALTKPWYLSRTIVGILISVAAKGLVLAGYNPTPEIEADLVNLVMLAASFVGDGLAVYGRVKATRQIGGKAPAGPPEAEPASPVARRPGPPAGSTLAVLLALAVAAGAVGQLSACASRVAETPAQKVYALQGELNGLLAVVATYVHTPDADTRPALKANLKRLAATAGGAVFAAQYAVRAGDDPALPAAYGAARAALDELSRYITEHHLQGDAGYDR